MKYVALLRGINVGGNNKVDMKQLIAAMEATDFNDVSTYINSGNIFFSSDKSGDVLVPELEAIIKEEFGLNIKVLIRTKPEIDTIVDAIPANWKSGGDMKCDVMFLWEKYDDSSVLDELVIKSGIDNVQYVKGTIIWKVDRENINKTGLMKLIGTDLYAHMTIRNCNTVRKIHERLS